MQKIYLLIFTILIAVLLTACGNGQADIDNNPADSPDENAETAIFKGKVAGMVGESALIIPLAEDTSSSLYLLPLMNIALSGPNAEIDSSLIKPGAVVEISYDGTIMESYPAQFGAATSLRVVKEEGDLVGLYLNVLCDLYDVDPGLNDGISILAFDLNAAENLSAAEKSALLYMAGAEYGLETMAGTFDELCEIGLIDKEALYFESGLLVSFSVQDNGETSFSFSADKWRGGLGAYFFTDCKAKLNGTSWSYTIGGQAIS